MFTPLVQKTLNRLDSPVDVVLIDLFVSVSALVPRAHPLTDTVMAELSFAQPGSPISQA